MLSHQHQSNNREKSAFFQIDPLLTLLAALRPLQSIQITPDKTPDSIVMHRRTLISLIIGIITNAQGPNELELPSSSGIPNLEGPIQSCIAILRHRASCCTPISRYTSTKSIDCYGCALSSTTIGPFCLVVSCKYYNMI
jgi:hypothetical protein